MDAIFGIIHWNQEVADDIEQMRSALSHLGPDGSDVWLSNQVALGCQISHTTSESSNKIQQMSLGKEKLVIVANVRLDNRDELLEQLEIHQEQKQIPDSKIILLAYRKWGKNCLLYLLGNFAFAIWDTRKKQLFCSNDHMGLRSFFYYHSKKRFIFSSEIKGILAVSNVPKKLNPKKILLHFLEEETYMTGISLLPKATTLTVDIHKNYKHNYWQPSLDNVLPYKNDEEYLEALCELLHKVVHAQLRSNSPVMALLSGGLDSSAIVAVAAKVLGKCGENLSVLSAVTNNNDFTDERDYIAQFESWANIFIHYITAEGCGPFDNLESIFSACDSPMITSRHYLYTAFSQVAKAKNSKVILDGIGGEKGLSFYGNGYFAELLLGGAWKTLAHEVKSMALKENISYAQIAHRHIIKPLFPNFLIDFLKKKTKNPQFMIHCLNPQFVKQNFTSELMEALASFSPFQVSPNHRYNQYHGIKLLSAKPTMVFAGYENIEFRYPLLDKRILEFCLAVPGHLKIRNGYKRYLLRATLNNILPSKIQWRTSKEPFSPDYSLRYNCQIGKIRKILNMISPKDPIREIIDIEKLKLLASLDMVETRNLKHIAIVPLNIYLIYFLRQFPEYQV